MKFLALIAVVAANEEAADNAVFGDCTLPEDHVYGTPSAGSCNPGEGDYAGIDIYCCANSLPDDPEGTQNDYVEGGAYMCVPSDYNGANPTDVDNVYVYPAVAIPLADGSTVEMNVQTDCNSATALAVGATVLAAAALF